jgi:tetratricopeptide (TPR) repeat protein
MTARRAVIAVTALCPLAGALELNIGIDSLGGAALAAKIEKTFTAADSLYTKGMDALDKNDFETAVRCFDDALQLFPDFSEARNNLGVVKYRKGDIGGAQEIWEKLAVKDPRCAVASYNLALVKIHERQYDAAIRLLERALKAEATLVEARVRLGAIHLERGERRKGLEILRKAYQTAPAHPDAWSFYSYALVENGDTSGAIAVLKKNSDKVEALKLLGRIESARKNYPAAAHYFSQAARAGTDPAMLLELANTQAEAKDCKGVLQTLNAYFSRNVAPTADAFLMAGIAAKECGDISAAQGYFEKGSQDFPQDGILRYNLGQIYFYLKKYEQAENTWGGLSDTLQDPSLLYLRAINAKRQNDLSAAESLIRRALEFDDRAEFHDFLGVILYRKGNGNEAETEFRKALRLNPNLRSAQINLALSARSAAELSAATAALAQRLASCPEDSCSDIALQLSILYYYQKMTDRAVSVLASVKESELDERICRTLAMYYRDLHEWNKVIATLEVAVKRFVTDPQTDYELAEAYLTAGFYSKAVERLHLLLARWQQNPWRIYYQLGYAYLEQNDLVNARECLEKSLNGRKDNAASRGLLAFIYNREGDVAQARELWKKNLNDDPSNAVLWVNMGLSYERDGKSEEALAYYKKAAELKHDDPQIQINIGNVYAAAGQYTDALAAYRQALNSPKRESAAYNIFLVYLKKRDKEEAEKPFALLEKEFASSADTKRARSEMALWNNDTARAIAVLDGLADKDAGDWVRLSQLFAARGVSQKARECLSRVPDEAQWESERAGIQAELAFQAGNYEKVVRLVREGRDTGFVSQYNCALAYYQLKRYTDALAIAECLVKAAKGPDRADLCRLAGNAAFGLKQWEKARQWYLQLSNVEARDPVVQYNLAVASYNLGDVDGAWIYYGRAREIDPKIRNADIEKRYGAAHSPSGAGQTVFAPIDSLYNAAVDMQRAGNDSAAEKIYVQIVAQDSLYTMAWNNLGTIYGKRGEIDKAEHAYQKAVEKKHDIPETYANLVNLYIALEEFTKARQWLVKGQGHNPDSDVLKDLKEKIVAAEKKTKKKQGE